MTIPKGPAKPKGPPALHAAEPAGAPPAAASIPVEKVDIGAAAGPGDETKGAEVETPAPAGGQEQGPAETSDAPAIISDIQADPDAEPDGDPDRVAAADTRAEDLERLAELDAAVAELDAAIKQCQDERARRQAVRDAFAAEFEKAHPAPTFHELHQAMVRRGFEQRSARHRGMQVLIELAGGPLPRTHRSALDEAMHRKNLRGAQRPAVRAPA